MSFTSAPGAFRRTSDIVRASGGLEPFSLSSRGLWCTVWGTRPNQVWAMDITHIPLARGFIYLAAVIGWFTRRVLAWRVSITLEGAA